MRLPTPFQLPFNWVSTPPFQLGFNSLPTPFRLSLSTPPYPPMRPAPALGGMRTH